MGRDGVGGEKNKPSERGAMKWKAGKARFMAITTRMHGVCVLYSRLGKSK